MRRTYVRLEVPKEVKDRKLKQEYLSTAEAILKEQTILRLYQGKRISAGAAARMLGIPLFDFMRFLGKHRIPMFQVTGSELEAQLRSARGLSRVRAKGSKSKK